MIHLTTVRLVIRDPLSTDINGWHRLLFDSKTMYYLEDIMTSSLEESRNNLDVAISESQKMRRKKYFLPLNVVRQVILLARLAIRLPKKYHRGNL